MVNGMKFRASHIIVIGVVAFALALGGGVGAVAGSKWIDGKDIRKNSIPANRLEKGSVGGKQIKKGAIRSSRIAADAITQQQLADDSVTTDELSDETVEELQPTVEYVTQRLVTTGHPTTPGFAFTPATCPTGTQAVAGYVRDRTAQWDPGFDYVDTSTGQFMVRIYSHDGTEKYADVQIMCLRP